MSPDAATVDVALLQVGTHPSTGRYARSLTGPLGDAVRAEPFVVAPSPLARGRVLTRLDDYFRRGVRYPRAARRLQADVLHMVEPSYAFIARRLDLRRMAVTCHDVIPLLGAEGTIPYVGKRSWIRRFKKGVAHLPEVAAVICPTQAVRADIVRLTGTSPDRVMVIPLGVDQAFSPPDQSRRETVRAEWARSGQGPFVLSMSTGGYYKNIEGTLEVVARLRREGIPARLVRTGVPLNAAQQERAERLGLSGVVLELGRLSEEDLIAAYGSADVLLFPSYYEGFGWPPLEAMACGLPVVASTAPAVVEVCGGAALHAAPDDHERLAQHVAEVLSDEAEHAGLVSAGLARSAEFTWERTRTAHAAVYTRIWEESAG